jgi:hypothetical protein
LRVRLKKSYKWRRVLAMGSAALVFKAGDYTVGEDIPEGAANGAINAGVAIKLPKRDMETKKRRVA